MHALRQYRLARNLSQGSLAEEIGVSRATVTRWENGARRVDTDILPRLVEITGLSPAQLRPDLAALLQDQEPAA